MATVRTRTSDVERLFRNLETQLLEGRPRTGERPDFTDTYVKSLLSRPSVTVMPTTPMSKEYSLELDYNSRDLRIDFAVKHKLTSEGREVWSKMPDEQKYHRERLVTIGSNPLVLNEFRRIRDRRNSVAGILAARKASVSESEAIARKVGEVTLRHLSLDRDHREKFLKEHAHAALGEGLRWEWFYETSNDEWSRAFDLTRQWVEELRDGKLTGMYFGQPYRQGTRGRAIGIPPGKHPEEVIRGSIDRSRGVWFHPVFSLVSLFMPNKRDWYRELLSWAVEKYLPTYHVTSPLLDGGDTYTRMRDAYREYGKLVGMDGVNWDGVVPVLGDGLSYFWATLYGNDHEPSGQFTTSLYATILTLREVGWILRNHGGDGTVSVMGDDFLGAFSNNKEIRDVPGYMEHQPEDVGVTFDLGIRLKDSKPQGFKLTADSAEKAIGRRLTHFGGTRIEPEHTRGKHTEREKALTAEQLLYGTIEGRDVIDLASDIVWRDDWSPSDNIRHHAVGL